MAQETPCSSSITSSCRRITISESLIILFVGGVWAFAMLPSLFIYPQEPLSSHWVIHFAYRVCRCSGSCSDLFCGGASSPTPPEKLRFLMCGMRVLFRDFLSIFLNSPPGGLFSFLRIIAMNGRMRSGCRSIRGIP